MTNNHGRFCARLMFSLRVVVSLQADKRHITAVYACLLVDPLKNLKCVHCTM